jgi:hypothetical protein
MVIGAFLLLELGDWLLPLLPHAAITITARPRPITPSD